MYEYQIAKQRQQDLIALAERRRVAKEAARAQRAPRRVRKAQVGAPKTA